MQEEEGKKLQLASAQEKKWLAELAAQHQWEWMMEEKTGGVHGVGTTRGNRTEIVGDAKCRRRFAGNLGKFFCSCPYS